MKHNIHKKWYAHVKGKEKGPRVEPWGTPPIPLLFQGHCFKIFSIKGLNFGLKGLLLLSLRQPSWHDVWKCLHILSGLFPFIPGCPFTPSPPSAAEETRAGFLLWNWNCSSVLLFSPGYFAEPLSATRNASLPPTIRNLSPGLKG